MKTEKPLSDKEIMREILRVEEDKTGIYDIESTTKKMIKKALKLKNKQFAEAVEELDEVFQRGFDDKLNRFILYPMEWKDLKRKIFGSITKEIKK